VVEAFLLYGEEAGDSFGAQDFVGLLSDLWVVLEVSSICFNISA